MQLVVDANILVAESLRIKGRKLLAHSDLRLITTTEVANETAYELRRRLNLMGAQTRLLQQEAADLLIEAETLIASSVKVAPGRTYVKFLAVAGHRIARDPDDVPAVALALALECGIWSSDRDFFGCGLPVWSTEVLQRHLDHLRQDPALADAVE
jgi:predicted nucleic acid-binding protein